MRSKWQLQYIKSILNNIAIRYDRLSKIKNLLPSVVNLLPPADKEIDILKLTFQPEPHKFDEWDSSAKCLTETECTVLAICL